MDAKSFDDKRKNLEDQAGTANFCAMNFHQRLAVRIDESRYSQKEFGIKVGVGQTTVSGWCKGSWPSGEHMVKIADTLEITLDELLRDDPPRRLTESQQEAVELVLALGLSKDDVIKRLANRVSAHRIEYDAPKLSDTRDKPGQS